MNAELLLNVDATGLSGEILQDRFCYLVCGPTLNEPQVGEVMQFLICGLRTFPGERPEEGDIEAAPQYTVDWEPDKIGWTRYANSWVAHGTVGVPGSDDGRKLTAHLLSYSRPRPELGQPDRREMFLLITDHDRPYLKAPVES